jgi:uncharacterized protein YjbI with pentapeptide repeats
VKRSLWWQLFGFIVAAISVGVGIFFLMRNVVFQDATEDKMSDIISSTITSMGVITIGGAAVIQLRKHIMYERQANSELLYQAIEHLKSEELYIRLGALDELRQLINKRSAKNICEILSAFVREHIENEKYLLPQNEEGRRKIQQDVYLAGEILSELYEKHELHADLRELQAPRVNLSELQLKGARLNGANFQGADLYRACLNGAYLTYANLSNADLVVADLRGANLWWADLSEANLSGADLRGAYLWRADLRTTKGLTAEQLRKAFWDDATKLDPALRAKLDELRHQRKDDPS